MVIPPCYVLDFSVIKEDVLHVRIHQNLVNEFLCLFPIILDYPKSTHQHYHRYAPVEIRQSDRFCDLY